jgi:hypothetical protein
MMGPVLPVVLAAMLADDPRWWAADLAIFVAFGATTAVGVWSWCPSFDRFRAGFRRK